MESTSAAMQPQKQLPNMTDLCLYLSYVFLSSADQSAPVGDQSAGRGNSTSLSSYPGDTGSIIDHTGSIIDPLLESIKYALAGVVNPTLCVFGLLGNIFNVVVLSRSRMQAAMNSTTVERSAYIGLIALAISDALYCISALLGAVQSRQQTAFRRDELVRMYVQLYGPYLQNTFMHTGCWLTVIMATGRYAAICRPLQACSSLLLSPSLNFTTPGRKRGGERVYLSSQIMIQKSKQHKIQWQAAREA